MVDVVFENIFTTPRLIIRSYAPDDWRKLQAFGGKPEVVRMMATLKSPWPEADVKAWMKSRAYCGKLGFGAGIYLRDTGMIGFLGIGGNPVHCAFAIDPDFWGKGYATEATRGLLEFSFGNLGLEVVDADHFIDNPASGRVLRKLGFVETGKSMGKSLARPQPAPLITYRLSRDQFEVAKW